MTIRWGGVVKVGWSVSLTTAEVSAELFDMLRGPVKVATEPMDSRRLLGCAIRGETPRYEIRGIAQHLR